MGLGSAYGEFGQASHFTIGSNWRLYTSGWAGGSAGRIVTTSIESISHYLGVYGTGLGILTDATGFLQNKIGGFHFGVNTTFGGIALFGGLPGAAISGGYFLTDTYYPHAENQSGAGAALLDYNQSIGQQTQDYLNQMNQLEGHPLAQATISDMYVQGMYGTGLH